MLPERRSRSTPDRHELEAMRATSEAELTRFRYALDTRLQADMDRLDTDALSGALRAALEAEVGLVEYGLRLAGNSQVKLELVADKVALLSEINAARIRRRFTP
jgi:hypothetical protein